MSRWTTKQPDRPGWWWARNRSDRRAVLLVKVADIDEMCIEGSHWCASTSGWKEWSDAPIEVPEEPEHELVVKLREIVDNNRGFELPAFYAELDAALKGKRDV